MSTDKVKVAVRVRPFNRREIELGTKCVVEMDEKQTILYHPSTEKGDSRKQPKTFAFDRCFWSLSENDSHYAGQPEVYRDLGVDILDNAFLGYNACIFAYGQTGSGKSYTMMGSHENSGLIPRLCDSLFERIAKNDDPNLMCKVEVSYMEIYNEKVHDLLDPKGTKQTLRVREHNILGPYVDGLSTLAVSSYHDIDNLMQEGNKSRTVAATNMNSESSRSHAVFNVILTQTLVDVKSGVSGEKVAKLSLVDLAGSERAVKTGAVGERLKEGSNINKSLTTLGLVISKLADQSSGKIPQKDKFVPYRDSVLTWLLKDNLGGNSKTVMVATISPASDNYEETLSTLRYADRAKRIINHAIINEDPNNRIIRELREEVQLLKERLKFTHQNEDIHEKLIESEKLMKEMSQTWEEKLHRTERIHQERQQTLEKMGISVQASGIKVEQNKYYLVNLNADPSLNELLVYYLKEHTLVGRPEAPVENDIQLSGLGIMPEHCIITIENSELFIDIKEGARTCVNGSVITTKTQLRNGDRILWGNNHFFKINCPKPSTPNSEIEAPARPIDYEFAREELMMKELSNDPIQAAMKELERQHEEDKQGALEKQRQMYERQLQMLRNQMSPSTPYAPYAAFDPFGFGKLTPTTPTVQSRVERWAQERYRSIPSNLEWQECLNCFSFELDELFKKSLAKLREDIVKANALVREANCLAEEMGNQTEFGVTLQIPAANLTPNRKKSAFVSEPAILVKRKNKPSQVWLMENLENKLIDMREMYNDRKDKKSSPKEDEPTPKGNDPFYESQENHNLIGVANIFLEVLFHDVKLAYHVPIISQQGEVAGRLHVEINRISGYIPDRLNDTSSDSSGESTKGSTTDITEENTSSANLINCRVSIKQATGLPPSLSNFVFCQYNFWGHPETIVVPPNVHTDYPSNCSGRDHMTIKFDHTKEFTVTVTEEFVEHCSEGALSIEVWGHRSAGFGSSRPGWEVDSQLLRSRSLADRWSELTRKIELLVEIHELNDQGEYSAVEVIVKPEYTTGGVYQLRQGQQRRILVRVRPVQNSGTLPIICEAITSIAVGGVVARNKLQKGLDSYQEEDLSLLREKWSDALLRRREYLDEQIQKIINKPNKTDQDVEREQNLIDQWARLTEEKNAVFVPAPNSGIPGEPAEWDPPAGMEKHIPVLFLDLNADDMSTSNSGDGIPVAGTNSILPKEHGTTLFSLPIVKHYEKDVCAVAAWDSSIHDSIYLNRVTPADERVYLILKAIIRLSHPATMELVLRKRLGVNVYKRQTLTDRIKKRIARTEAYTLSGVTYELVSNIPKASEELEDREYLAQMAASGEDTNASDGESYIEKYTRGVSAVESILTLDRLRQQVAMKELLTAQGRPLRKTASVPNISHILRMDSSSGRLEEQFRAESIGDISSSNTEQYLRQRSNSLTGCKLQSSKDCKPSTSPFGLARPTFLNLNLNLNLRPQATNNKSQGSQPTKLVKPMRTLLEEQYHREAKPLLDSEKNLQEEDEEEEETAAAHVDTTQTKPTIPESDDDYSEFESYQVSSKEALKKDPVNQNEIIEEGQLQTKADMPSMSSSGYSSQAVSSTTLSSDDSLSLRSISVDETPDAEVRLLKDTPTDRSGISPMDPVSEDIATEMCQSDDLLNDSSYPDENVENSDKDSADALGEMENAEVLSEEAGTSANELTSNVNDETIINNDQDSDPKDIADTCLSTTDKSLEDVACKIDSADGDSYDNSSDTKEESAPIAKISTASPTSSPEIVVRRRSKGESRMNFTAHRASYPAAIRPQNNTEMVNHFDELNFHTVIHPSSDDTLRNNSSPPSLSSQSSLHVPNDIDGDDSTSQSSFGSRADLSRLSDTSLPDWMQIGESILIRPYNYAGAIAFIGATEFASGVWIGVELDAPTGKNDGSVNGVRYFTCRPRCGIFVRPDKLILDKRGRAIRSRHSAIGDVGTLRHNQKRADGLSSSLTEMHNSWGNLQRSKSKGDGLSRGSELPASGRLRRSKSRGEGMSSSFSIEVTRNRNSTLRAKK